MRPITIAKKRTICKGLYKFIKKKSFDRHKKKEVLVATQSDDENDESIDKEEINLALTENNSYSSDEDEDDVNSLTQDELMSAFDELNDNFDNLFKLNKSLKKKNKGLEIEMRV